MHHKRSKMKPEEELPSPGAVSVQVRVVKIFWKYKDLSAHDVLHLHSFTFWHEPQTAHWLVNPRIKQPALFLGFFFLHAHIRAGHLPKWLQQ